jgi:dTDP-4-dehydrorhamnose 3,5-epimerase
MPQQVLSLDIPEVKIYTPRRFSDARGVFSETFSAKIWREAGASGDFVQDNQSCSTARGTIRGLHFQTPPFAQAKLVRVLRGAIFDVAVDIRSGSPTFGRYVSATLTADEGNQMYVPVGFAHGFCTLEPETEVFYKVSNYYSPESEGGICWDDPGIGIAWPIRDAVTLSEKDARLPALTDVVTGFQYQKRT